MKTIDLSNRFDTTKPTIKINDTLTITVENDKNAVLSMQQALSNNTEGTADAKLTKMLIIAIGEENVKVIDDLKLSYRDYLTFCAAVLASATDEDFESVAERFQREL